MLKWLRKEWLLVTAILGFCLFWTLVFSGKIPSAAPYQGSPCDAAHKCNQYGPLTLFWNWIFHDAISFFTAVLAVFTGGLVGVSLRADKTARLVARNGARQTVIARRQLMLMGLQSDTIIKQKELQRIQIGHFRVTERAYLKLSHEPPGLVWDQNIEGRLSIMIQTRNYGRTPARVLNFSMATRAYGIADTLSPQPDYNPAVQRGAFLVADDRYSHITTLTIPKATKEAVMGKSRKLAVLAYTEYLDQFGTHHRAGYGRWYEPDRDVRPSGVSKEDFAERTNLTYIEDIGYNYDEVIADNA
jgi:hypothetical protein